MQRIEIAGQKFGRLTVIEFSHVGKNSTQWWKCKCDCGNEAIVISASLRWGLTKSCGCIQKEVLRARSIIHGMYETAEFKTWQRIIGRCTNPNNPKYFDYGMRGIEVCERWLHSFENFYADMGDRPSPKHSIDRYPDNDGNYEPTNCRWGTQKQQAGNTRRNHWYEHEGRKMILADWTIELGVKHAVTLGRYLRNHSMQEAIEHYAKKKLKVIE